MKTVASLVCYVAGITFILLAGAFSVYDSYLKVIICAIIGSLFLAYSNNLKEK